MSTCRCRRIGTAADTLKPGDEVHINGYQGFVINTPKKGQRPFVLTWRSVYSGSSREWKFYRCEQLSGWWKHRKTNPLHLDFHRSLYGHD